MVDKSMADDLKVEESMADNTIPWRMVYAEYIIIRIIEHKKIQPYT